MDTTDRHARGVALPEDAGREALARARRAARAGRLDAAAELLQGACIALPTLELSRLDLLAKVHAQRGSFAAAEQCWLAALELDPRAMGAHQGLHELRRRRMRPDLTSVVRRGLLTAVVVLAAWLLASRLNSLEARVTDIGARASQENMTATADLRGHLDVSLAAVGTELRGLAVASTRAQDAAVSRLEAAFVAARRATDQRGEASTNAVLARLGGLETELLEAGQRTGQGLRTLGAALAEDGELPKRLAQLRAEFHAELARVSAAMSTAAAPLRSSLAELARDQTAAQAGLDANVRTVVAELTRLGQRIDAVVADLAQLRAAAAQPKTNEPPKVKAAETAGGKSDVGKQP